MNRRALLIAAVVASLLLSACRSYGPPMNRKFFELMSAADPSRDARNVLSPSADVRRWSILNLARYGDLTAMPAIAARLSHTVEKVPLVRATAATGLRVLGDKRAVPHLIRALGDPDSVVRADVVRALGMLGDQQDIRALSRRLSMDRDAAVRLQAALAIARIGGDDAVAPLVSALDDIDPSVAFASHTRLIELTGQDLPATGEAWNSWLEKRKKPAEG